MPDVLTELSQERIRVLLQEHKKLLELLLYKLQRVLRCMCNLFRAHDLYLLVGKVMELLDIEGSKGN